MVYNRIRQALGIRKNVISGGGSLASHLDDFYEVIGLEVLNGWGLSEVMCTFCPTTVSLRQERLRKVIEKSHFKLAELQRCEYTMFRRHFYIKVFVEVI